MRSIRYARTAATCMLVTLASCSDPRGVGTALPLEPNFSVEPVAPFELYASTNQGELLTVDVATGTVAIVGDAGAVDGRQLGWTGLSFDPDGNLFASSRQRSESTDDGCTGFYNSASQGRCSHLYLLDSGNGAVLAELGSTRSSWISDIDFSATGTLFAIDYFDSAAHGDGGLVTLDLTDGSRSEVGRFGSADAHRDLDYGGLTVTDAGEVWGIENDFATPTPRYLFNIDPKTGAALRAYALTSNGSPVGFGFAGLEITPDGRLIASRGQGVNELYEIAPDDTLGTAEVVPIPVTWPSLAGTITGLEALTVEIGTSDLLARIQELVDSGALHPNKSRSLVAKVNAAEFLIDGDRTSAAISVLEALLHQIESLIAAEDVTAVQLEPLCNDVLVLIDQLSGT